MKKELKYKKAIRTFYYWCGRLGLSKTIPNIKDNRLDCTFQIDIYQKEEKNCLKFNSKLIEQQEWCITISDIFHEIGHLINKLPYDTCKQQVISEREAERFSIRRMKKYYPKQFRLLLNQFKKTHMMQSLLKTNKLHYRAFIQLEDYKNTI